MRNIMSVLKNIAVEIDGNRIAAMLKSGEKQMEDLREMVSQEIKSCLTMFQTQIAYEKLDITAITADTVCLASGLTLEGPFIAEKLADCSYVIMSVYTLGQPIDDYIHNCFDGDDYLRGLIADTISVAALTNLEKTLWNKLVDEIDGTTLGITSRLSPGDAGWDLKEQRKIYECLRSNADIGVALTESCMMTPLKSASAVYGIGEGIGIARVGHVCGDCMLKNCAYRIRDEYKLTVSAGQENTTLMAEYGDNLYEVLKKHRLIASFPCAGNGTCGKCAVKITSGVPEPAPEDERHLSPQELADGLRLACRIKIRSPMELTLAFDTEDDGFKIMADGITRDIPVDSPVIKKHFLLKNAVPDDCRSDLRKVMDGLKIWDSSPSLPLLRELSETLRSAQGGFTAVACNNKLIAIEKGDTVGSSFGVFVDIGTTTVVCCLVDLCTGSTVDVEAAVNSQSAYGADVISRISYTCKSEGGTETLRGMIIRQINEMVRCLCERNGITLAGIYNMAVAGNTTMIHFFLGVPTDGIAVAPFTPVITSAAEFSASALGIESGGVVSVLPGIAGFVGSDITAGILACGIMEAGSYSLLIDLGTNGEIALGNSQGLTVCSVAAGPAFDGGNIKYGVGGVTGAICGVDLGRETHCQTIGNAVARGICGSGVLDTVSELLKHGIIDETGRMAGKEAAVSPPLRALLSEEGGARQFLLERDTTLGIPIAFTQKDVRQVQLAKAAFSAGIRLLIKEAGICFEDIDKVYIAGGFGNFMNADSALNIGLIPEELRGKTVTAGNTANAGARLYLINKTCRKKAVRIAEFARYIELSGRAEFQNLFIESMNFEKI
jgi:uncharacterized 2Fe-2S/4Fe-4S cluster protein (DUF4445 family)